MAAVAIRLALSISLAASSSLPISARVRPRSTGGTCEKRATHAERTVGSRPAMYAATGSAQYQTQLFQWFPNPADSSTFRWGWWQMAESYGNAIRTYAFAAKSGRLALSALDPTYLAACNAQIVAEETDEGILLRPGVTFPVELYSDARLAEFHRHNEESLARLRFKKK